MAHGAYLHLTGSKSTYWSAYWMCHGGSWCVCKQGTYPYSNGQNLGYTPFSDPLKYQFVRVKYPTISTQYVWIYIHILFYVLLYMCKPFTAPTYSHYRPIIYIHTHTLYNIYIYIYKAGHQQNHWRHPATQGLPGWRLWKTRAQQICSEASSCFFRVKKSTMGWFGGS